jgi:hypothetical protein
MGGIKMSSFMTVAEGHAVYGTPQVTVARDMGDTSAWKVRMGERVSYVYETRYVNARAH